MRVHLYDAISLEDDGCSWRSEETATYAGPTMTSDCQ